MQQKNLGENRRILSKKAKYSYGGVFHDWPFLLKQPTIKFEFLAASTESLLGRTLVGSPLHGSIEWGNHCPPEKNGCIHRVSPWPHPGGPRCMDPSSGEITGPEKNGCIHRASLWRISLKSLLDNLPSGIFLIPEIF